MESSPRPGSAAEPCCSTQVVQSSPRPWWQLHSARSRRAKTQNRPMNCERSLRRTRQPTRPSAKPCTKQAMSEATRPEPAGRRRGRCSPSAAMLRLGKGIAWPRPDIFWRSRHAANSTSQRIYRLFFDRRCGGVKLLARERSAAECLVCASLRRFPGYGRTRSSRSLNAVNGSSRDFRTLPSPHRLLCLALHICGTCCRQGVEGLRLEMGVAL
jgi:hypothetical protein